MYCPRPRSRSNAWEGAATPRPGYTISPVGETGLSRCLTSPMVRSIWNRRWEIVLEKRKIYKFIIFQFLEKCLDARSRWLWLTDDKHLVLPRPRPAHIAVMMHPRNERLGVMPLSSWTQRMRNLHRDRQHINLPPFSMTCFCSRESITWSWSGDLPEMSHLWPAEDALAGGGGGGWLTFLPPPSCCSTSSKKS